MAKTTTEKKPITRGAVLLQRFLEDEGLSMNKLCKMLGVERLSLARVFTGEAQHVSVDLAYRVSELTKNAISPADFRETTKR